MFSVRSSGYQFGCTVAGVSSQWQVEHTLQNITTEWTTHSVVILARIPPEGVMHFPQLNHFATIAFLISHTSRAWGCNSMVDMDAISPLQKEVMANRPCTFRSSYPGFACSSGQCIKASWLCDGGAADCEDGSDESPDVCGHRYCVFESYHGGFTCSNGQCIKARDWNLGHCCDEFNS